MTNTQWPRWEVFKQDSERKPHQAVGTVHAVDREHALLNARNVFVRRPRAVSIWVAPSDAIFSMTEQELVRRSDWYQPPPSDLPEQNYLIFRKTNQRRSMTFVTHEGDIHARSAAEALHKALAQFEQQQTFVWWIVPETALVRSAPEDSESWFEPAADKTYKQQSQYGFVSARRRHRRNQDR